MAEATYENALKAMRAAHERGDAEGARRMAEFAKSLQSKQTEQPEGGINDIPYLQDQEPSLGTEAMMFAREAISGLMGASEAGGRGIGKIVSGQGVSEASKTIEETIQKRIRPAETPKAQAIMETLGEIGTWIDDKTFRLGTVAEDIPVIGPEIATGIKTGADVAISVLTARLVKKGVNTASAKKIAKAATAAEREAELVRAAERDKNFIKRTNFKKSKEIPSEEPLPYPPSKIKKKSDAAGIEISKKRFIKRYKKSRSGDDISVDDLNKEARMAWRGYIKKAFAIEDAKWAKERAAYEASLRKNPVVRGNEKPVDLPKVKEMSRLSDKARTAGDNVADVLSTVVTRLDSIDPTKTLSLAIRKMEHGIEKNMVVRNNMLDDFYAISKEMYNSDLKGNWHKAYLDQDWDRLRALAIQAGAKPRGKFPFTKRGVDYSEVFSTAKMVLNDMGEQALRSNFKGFKLIENYIPRHISERVMRRLREDPEMQAYLGPDKMDKLRKVYNREWDDNVTRMEAINAALTGGGEAKIPAVVAQSAKKRGQLLGEELYEPMHVALQRYVNDMTESIEIRKFLGKERVKNSPNLDESLTKMVDDNAHMLNLGAREQDILKNVLSARFKEGRMHAPKWIQTLKNFGYITSIGNVWSTITQVGDIVSGMRTLGMRNVLGGLKDVATGRKVRIADIGYESIMKELADPSRSSKWLDKTLGASGFKSMDKLGKTVVVNGSRRKYMKMARTEKGRAKIARDYEAMFRDAPEEYAKFLDDLKVGNIHNENVKFAIFNDLADLQPITLSDMPLSYLKGQKYGRLLWALKTWSAQQLNTLYRHTVQEAKRGNRVEAAKNLTKFVTYNIIVGTAGIDTFKEWLAKMAAGENLTAEDVSDNTSEAFLRTMFISRYSIEKSRGTLDFWHYITDVFSPSLQGTLLRAERATKKEDTSDSIKELLKLAPIIGSPYAAVERAKDDKN